MRVLRHMNSTFLDFIENTRVGSAGFRLARFGLFALGILVVSRVASRQFLSFTFSDVLFMGITAVAFLLLFWQPAIGIVMVLATTSFIAYYDTMPTLSLYHFIPEIKVLEQLRLVLGQAIMLYLLVLFATGPEMQTARQRLATRLAPAVLFFLAAIALATSYGVLFGGVGLGKAIETSRSYTFYLMFFITLLCINSRRQMNALLISFLIMAIIVAILMFVQFALGTEHRVFIGHGIRVETFGGYAGRILPPGVDLIWMVTPFVIAAVPIASPHTRRLLIGALALLLGGLLLTFTRTAWIGTLWSMVLMAILGRGAIRRGVLRMFLVLGIFIAVLLVALQVVSTEEHNYMTPYVQRFTSIFDPESYGQGTSAGARWMEIQAAWPHIVDHPWLGIGVGAGYRQEAVWDDAAQMTFLQPKSYIHNAYILLLTDTGLIGFTACMVMYITFFVRARRIFYWLDRPADKAIVMAGIGAIAALMLASLMQPSFWYPPSVPCIGTIFGLVEATRYLRQRELARQ